LFYKHTQIGKGSYNGAGFSKPGVEASGLRYQAPGKQHHQKECTGPFHIDVFFVVIKADVKTGREATAEKHTQLQAIAKALRLVSTV
jgi:hypothetical protein